MAGDGRRLMFYDAITEFIFVEDEPRKADIIFIPGSFRPELAGRAAGLYHEGYAPYILPSGKHSIKGNASIYDRETESDFLGRILRAEGVPQQAILREPEATFTWENAIYSRRVTEAAQLPVQRAILCCKAFHARRSLMYYQQQFPDTDFIVCPVVVDGISRQTWHQTRSGIDTVLGEVERCGGQFHEIMADRITV
ncbi:MAG: YdcF family protein [Lachnospiraceae bacterium]|nr:YdcF family protein [Lachnospiraceae bacterium]